ncbi:hypothetical protein QTP88_015550 [Uroleucon formosanum]
MTGLAGLYCSSKETVKYFGLMQHLFTFFTISTHRWEILSNNLKPGTHTLNVVSEKLQKVEIDCGLVVELYDSLIQLITNTRENVNEFERKAIEKSVTKEYKDLKTRPSHDDIVKRATQLNELYYNDVDLNEFINEYLHLKAHIIQLADDKQKNVPKLLQILHEKNLISIYPNIEIALRIYKSTAVTNCSAERSFSCLKRIKNYLRSAMSRL